MKMMEGNSLVLALDCAGNPSARLDNRMAVPLILNSKTILADQIEFLEARLRRKNNRRAYQ